MEAHAQSTKMALPLVMRTLCGWPFGVEEAVTFEPGKVGRVVHVPPEPVRHGLHSDGQSREACQPRHGAHDHGQVGEARRVVSMGAFHVREAQQASAVLFDGPAQRGRDAPHVRVEDCFSLLGEHP